MTPKFQEIITKHFGNIILSLSIIIGFFIYAEINRYSHIQGVLVLDHWTGNILKESVRDKSRPPNVFDQFDPK